jgi:hypothetical protein
MIEYLKKTCSFDRKTSIEKNLHFLPKHVIRCILGCIPEYMIYSRIQNMCSLAKFRTLVSLMYSRL